MRKIFILTTLIIALFASPSFREVDDSYKHTGYEDCTTCHDEITKSDEYVAPDWYPKWGKINGELVTVWETDGDNCTLYGGVVVPCWWISPVPMLPSSCDNGLPEL